MRKDLTTLAAAGGALALFVVAARKAKADGSVSDSLPGGDFILSAPSSVVRWAETVQGLMNERQAAGQLTIDPNLVLAIIWQESYGRPDAGGAAGEIGLMQLLPSTAADFGVSNPADLYDPATNIRAGVRYLAYCFDRMPSVYDAVRAYNAGVYGATSFPERAKAYANQVLNRYYQTSGVDWS